MKIRSKRSSTTKSKESKQTFDAQPRSKTYNKQKKILILKNYKTIDYTRISDNLIEIQGCNLIKRSFTNVMMRINSILTVYIKEKLIVFVKGNIRMKEDNMVKMNEEGKCKIIK